MFENAVKKLIDAGWSKDEVFDYVEKIFEEETREAKIKTAREKVADATAEYMKLLTGIDMDVAQFIKDVIKEEEKVKDADFMKTKAEVKYKQDAVNEWLKENDLF